MLDRLPTDLAAHVLALWVLWDGEELAWLDVAYTNRLRRPALAEIFRETSARIFNLKRQPELALNWLATRQVKVCTLGLYSHLVGEIAEVKDSWTFPSTTAVFFGDAFDYAEEALQAMDPVQFIKVLSMFPIICELDLEDAQSSLTDDLLFALCDYSSVQLRKLALPRSSSLSSVAVVSVVSHFASTLENLVCTSFGATLCDMASRLSELRQISLIVAQGTSEDAVLDLIRHNPKIEHVTVRNQCFDLTLPMDDTFVGRLAEICPRLQSLVLSSCSAKYHSCSTVLKHCADVRTLSLGGVALQIHHDGADRRRCSIATADHNFQSSDARRLMEIVGLPVKDFSMMDSAVDVGLLSYLAETSGSTLKTLNIEVPEGANADEVNGLVGACLRLRDLSVKFVFNRHERARGDAIRGLLCGLGAVRGLEALAITNARELSDDMVEAALQGRTGMTKLEFVGCDLLSSATMVSATRLCPQLKRLRLTRRNVTRAAIPTELQRIVYI